MGSNRQGLQALFAPLYSTNLGSVNSVMAALKNYFSVKSRGVGMLSSEGATLCTPWDKAIL
jgi:hypothetical protein